MEEFMEEHGSVLISGLIAVASVVAAVVIVYAAGEMNYISTISVIGG